MSRRQSIVVTEEKGAVDGIAKARLSLQETAGVNELFRRYKRSVIAMEVLLVLSVVGMGIVHIMLAGSFGWVSIGIGIYTFLLANVLNFKDSLSRLYHSKCDSMDTTSENVANEIRNMSMFKRSGDSRIDYKTKLRRQSVQVQAELNSQARKMSSASGGSGRKTSVASGRVGPKENAYLEKLKDRRKSSAGSSVPKQMKEYSLTSVFGSSDNFGAKKASSENI